MESDCGGHIVELPLSGYSNSRFPSFIAPEKVSMKRHGGRKQTRHKNQCGDAMLERGEVINLPQAFINHAPHQGMPRVYSQLSDGP
jgi:hypothetical protein